MTKIITASQVRAACAKADRAELAVERHQIRNGYARSNDKTRELRSKASKLRSEALSLDMQFRNQTR